MIRKRKAKVYWGQVLLFAFTHTNVIYTDRQKARPNPALDNSLRRKQNKPRCDEGSWQESLGRSLLVVLDIHPRKPGQVR
jgi:hypothetical protein